MLKLYASSRRAKVPAPSPSSGDASSSCSPSSCADSSSLPSAAVSSIADNQKKQGQRDVQVAETGSSNTSCDPSVAGEKFFSPVSPAAEATASSASRVSPAGTAAGPSLAPSPSSAQPSRSRRLLPGELRLQKELEDLDLPSQCALTFASAAAASSAAVSSRAAAAGRRSGRGGAAAGGRAATQSSSSSRRVYQQHSGAQESSDARGLLAQWLPWPGEDDAEERSTGCSQAAGAVEAAAPSSSSSSSLLNMQLQIRPDEGYWRGGCFSFSICVPPTYPHDPPKVKCLNQICSDAAARLLLHVLSLFDTPHSIHVAEEQVFHPNIDSNGNVCLNILREDWKPVLSLSAVVYGLLHLFLEPNPNDPLNEEAANLLRCNPIAFEHHARRLLHSATR